MQFFKSVRCTLMWVGWRFLKWETMQWIDCCFNITHLHTLFCVHCQSMSTNLSLCSLHNAPNKLSALYIQAKYCATKTLLCTKLFYSYQIFACFCQFCTTVNLLLLTRDHIIKTPDLLFLLIHTIHFLWPLHPDSGASPSCPQDKAVYTLSN